MKKLLAAILVFLTFTALFAKEMELYKNFDGAEEFATLTAEEQYNSYINSFKKIKDPREQPMKWAYRMVDRYGREVLPYFNKTLLTLTLDHVYRKPYDSTLTCIFYFSIAATEKEILTENEKKLYAQIIESKIQLYLLKYGIFDRTVIVAAATMIELDESYDIPWRDDFKIKAEYEKKLGIKIEMGDLEKMWED